MSPTPKIERAKSVVDVHLLLMNGNSILLGKRTNTGFGDGSYHPPAGHLEAGESVLTALIRETKEEIGVTVDPANVRLAHVMHHSSGGGRVAFFFEVRQWEGTPANLEPDKCAGWAWFPMDDLPEKLIPYAERALRSINDDEVFSVYGW